MQCLDQLPVFNADLEGEATLHAVLSLCEQIYSTDGLVISRPEYVRSMPGSLKNAIDWLVSRQEFSTQAIAVSDAYTRSRAVADRGDAQRGLDTLERLD